MLAVSGQRPADHTGSLERNGNVARATRVGGISGFSGKPFAAPVVTNSSTGMENDHEVVRRAIGGDERALRSLWTRYSPYVDAVIRRLAGDPDLAADIAQEVWIQIFRALPSWRGESQFGTWAHRIAVNRSLNALRRTKRLGQLEAPIEEDSAQVEHDGERSILAATIEEAASRLSPGARTVFYLHDVEGYTHEEIAGQLGITAGGSKSQLFKARAKLRKLLAHLVDDESRPVHRQNDRQDREHVAPY